jgi:hypothetical protein
VTPDDRARILETFIRKVVREEIDKALRKKNQSASSKSRTKKVRSQSVLK